MSLRVKSRVHESSDTPRADSSCNSTCRLYVSPRVESRVHESNDTPRADSSRNSSCRLYVSPRVESRVHARRPARASIGSESHICFKGLLLPDKTGLANIHRKHNRARCPARAPIGSESHTLLQIQFSGADDFWVRLVAPKSRTKKTFRCE